MLYLSSPVAMAVLAYLHHMLDTKLAFMTHQYVNGRETGFQVIPMICEDEAGVPEGWRDRHVVISYDSRVDMICVYCFNRENRLDILRCPRPEDIRQLSHNSKSFDYSKAAEAAEFAKHYILAAIEL